MWIYLFILKQVPGVEADDVIGTLAVRSVDAGFKVFSLPLFIGSIIYWGWGGCLFSYICCKWLNLSLLSGWYHSCLKVVLLTDDLDHLVLSIWIRFICFWDLKAIYYAKLRCGDLQMPDQWRGHISMLIDRGSIMNVNFFWGEITRVNLIEGYAYLLKYNCKAVGQDLFWNIEPNMALVSNSCPKQYCNVRTILHLSGSSRYFSMSVLFFNGTWLFFEIIGTGTSCLPRQRFFPDIISFITPVTNCSSWVWVSISLGYWKAYLRLLFCKFQLWILCEDLTCLNILYSYSQLAATTKKCHSLW